MEEHQGSACSDTDEPIVEVTDEELRPDISPYVLKPCFKLSAVLPSRASETPALPRLRHGDTVVGRLPPAVEEAKFDGESTPKKKFNPESNPHDLVRCAQKEKYVWYAVCDEEMQTDVFVRSLQSCIDPSPPIVLGSC